MYSLFFVFFYIYDIQGQFQGEKNSQQKKQKYRLFFFFF